MIDSGSLPREEPSQDLVWARVSLDLLPSGVLLDPSVNVRSLVVRSLAGNLACIVVGFVYLIWICTMQRARAQSVAQSHTQFTAPGPMAQVARDYAWRPARADVLPLAQGATVGDRVPVKVLLLDASGKLDRKSVV